MTVPSILFVCLGNICRSPLAEAAFRAEAEAAGLKVHIDSAGTGDWHLGKGPDHRAQAEAKRHGHDISGYKARQVKPEDFNRFTYIFALDPQNLADLQQLAPTGSTAEVALLMDLVPGREGTGVNDPYYGDESDFEISWADVSAAAKRLLARF